ncbi:MAG: Csp1 family four helix bundle copper storage protein [Myxococcota bacterium]
MNRRDFFLVGGATAVAHAVTTTLACGAQSGGHHGPHGSGHVSEMGHLSAVDQAGSTAHQDLDPKLATLAAASADCVEAAASCVAHCVQLLGRGDTSMADCARASREVAAVCQSMLQLAASGSSHAAALARVCRDVCAECAEFCRPHAAHHPQCRACLEACEHSVSACDAVLA